jgi:hypothetical protein
MIWRWKNNASSTSGTTTPAPADEFEKAGADVMRAP